MINIYYGVGTKRVLANVYMKNAQVSFMNSEGLMETYLVEHIGRQGFFLRGPQLPKGDCREYQMRFPYGDTVFSMQGRVVERTMDGIGVQYALNNPLQENVFM